jgi:tRNA pseudouridine32 synthase / 23S rRNA pseudouridine746 synthase
LGIPILIYQDDWILVTEKEPGLLCVPGKGPDKADCLFSRLQESFPELRVVHRLDQPTSGLMLWARTAEAQKALGRQFEQRAVKKAYEALVLGSPPEEAGRISFFQRLDPENRPLQILDPDKGKEGITLWETVEFLPGGLSRVRLYPQTGRTHQLRLHMASIGCPILGDPLYGKGRDERFGRMCLHACSLEFSHPENISLMSFNSKVPF